MPRDFKIGRYSLGPNHKPFIVAEMSGNHNQSLERALAIVDAAAKAGAHAVKLQTYTADTMTLNIKDGPFLISDPKSLWNGRTLYDLYEEAATPYEWHRPIMEKCRSHGMECFSSPFDESAVDFLEELNVPCYKIASFENTDLPLIKKAAATGKPLIISTGMASLTELNEAVSAARGAGAKDILLLKCTSSYPSSPEDSNLRTIPHLRDAFNVHVGLSDHTTGIGVSLASIALGAIFVEKHFTLDRSHGGVDSAFSIEPSELNALVLESERAWQGMGTIKYQASSQEEKSKQFRRTIRVKRDLESGEILRREDLAIVRPGGGVPPSYIDLIVGKRITKSLKAGTAISMDNLLS
ncbi:MAG: pseudaminic acid synthase [Flavobacterium sp.]|nr:MAG: pseudaminic acid synthase [Flavobacterium sp.]